MSDNIASLLTTMLCECEREIMCISMGGRVNDWVSVDSGDSDGDGG